MDTSTPLSAGVKSETMPTGRQAVEDLKVDHKVYSIGDKNYYLWDDFDFDEKEWLDVVYNKLTTSPRPSPNLGEGVKNNEVSGSFTKNEMLKTLHVLLRNEDGSYCDKNVFRKTRESLQVKILADFFLSKAILGVITTGFSKLSETKKSEQLMSSMN